LNKTLVFRNTLTIIVAYSDPDIDKGGSSIELPYLWGRGAQQKGSYDTLGNSESPAHAVGQFLQRSAKT